MLWKAIEVAFFLWIFTMLFRCCCGSRKSKAKPSSSSYQKLADPAAPAPGTNGAVWYGSAPAQALPAYQPATEKYEPYKTQAAPSPAPPYGVPGAGAAASYYAGAAAVQPQPQPYAGAAPAPYPLPVSPVPSVQSVAPAPPPLYQPQPQQAAAAVPLQYQQLQQTPPVTQYGGGVGATYAPGAPGQPAMY